MPVSGSENIRYVHVVRRRIELNVLPFELTTAVFWRQFSSKLSTISDQVTATPDLRRGASAAAAAFFTALLSATENSRYEHQHNQCFQLCFGSGPKRRLAV
jgi:hypothetical protein